MFRKINRRQSRKKKANIDFFSLRKGKRMPALKYVLENLQQVILSITRISDLVKKWLGVKNNSLEESKGESHRTNPQSKTVTATSK